MVNHAKKEKQMPIDHGRVVAVNNQGFTTSTGTSFDFPFPVSDVSVEEMNSYWSEWSQVIDKMIQEKPSDNKAQRNG